MAKATRAAGTGTGRSEGSGGGNSLETMYKGKSNSLQTSLTESISAETTTIPVANINAFPEAPNLATIGSGDNAEVIRYNGIDGARLTGCERGFGGTTASVWETGSPIYRAYTAHDHDTFIANIERLSNEKLDAAPHGSNHALWGSDPIRIDAAQIDNMPTEMTPTAHATTHKIGGSDALTLMMAQISDFPTAMTPTAHTHTKAQISDFPTEMTPTAHTHTKAQISDFPTEMTPTAHTHTKAQISDFPTEMTPTAHTHTKAQISDFPTAMTPTAHKNTHKKGGSDALTAVDIGAVAGIIAGANITTSVNAATGQVTVNAAAGGALTEAAATLNPNAAWNTNTRQQSVAVAAVAGKTKLIIAPNMAAANSYEEWCNCGVRCVSRSGNTLTFQCETIPTIAIGVSILAS